jgi:RNA polymerase sigma-70 factor (sigma-E family)
MEPDGVLVRSHQRMIESPPSEPPTEPVADDHRVARDIESFCRDVHPRLVASMRALTGSNAVGEEIAQEALARTWQHWKRVSEMEHPEAWCWRVATNLATSRLRRLVTERRANQRFAPSDGSIPAVDIARDVALRAAIAKLPQRQRSVIALRFVADLDVETTAAALGIPVGTVKSSTSRALDTLRALLTDFEA